MNALNKNNLFLLEELVKKNFSTRYKDSYLGILWTVIRPLLTMMILTVVFSALFNRIENYPVYLLSGRMLFRYFSGTCGSSMTVLGTNTNILLQKDVPKYIFILATLISEFIDYLISLGLLFVVMLVTGAPFYITLIPLSIIPLISLIIMTTGACLILSVLAVYYKDVIYLWGAFSQLLMYGSALFYPLDIIPEPYYSVIILNPMLWIIDQFRHFILYGSLPDLLNVINSYFISTMILIIGIIVFKKYEKRLTIQF